MADPTDPASREAAQQAAGALLHGDAPIETASAYLTAAWHRLAVLLADHNPPAEAFQMAKAPDGTPVVFPQLTKPILPLDQDDWEFLEGLSSVMSALAIVAHPGEKRGVYRARFEPRRKKKPVTIAERDRKRDKLAAAMKSFYSKLEAGMQKTQAKAEAAAEHGVSMRDVERARAQPYERLGVKRGPGRPRNRKKPAPVSAD